MKLKIRSNFLLLLISFIFLVSCGGGSNGAEPIGAFNQKYFFVIERQSVILAPFDQGISIDNNGDVFHYTLDGPPPTAPNNQITEQFLDTLFNTQQIYLGTIDSTIFAQKIGLITEAANGQAIDPIIACLDAGTYKYSAYTFNTFSGIYEQVTVYRTGEFITLIDNPAAIELRDWLIQIAIDNQIALAGSICTGDFTSLSGP